MARGPRRPSSGPHVADVEHYNRVMQRMERMGSAITDRLDELFTAMDQRLIRIETRVTSSERDRAAILGEVAEIRRDQGEMRDLVNKVMRPSFLRGRRGQIIIGSAGAITGGGIIGLIIAAIEHGPAIGHFLAYLVRFK